MSSVPINQPNRIVEITEFPDKCPFCHNAITPIPSFANLNGNKLDVFLKCPNKKCDESFIGYYENNPHIGITRFLGKTTQGRLVDKDFSDIITSISSGFTVIYNQAYQAEQENLTEICGVGYRKALEFLIKDYLLLNHPDESEIIKRKPLGNCISDYVSNANVKSVASRAVWLGNDETHYVRKWEGKDLNDLKKLIELTVHWIEMEKLTISFETEMPA